MPRVIRLLPSLPVVWQDPSTAQIGVDPPVCILPNLDDRFVPLLHNLRGGMTLAGLRMVAKRSHISEVELDDFLEHLGAALGDEPQRATPRLHLDYTSATSAVMEDLWRHLGYEVTRVGVSAPQEEVIVVGDYVLDPESHHRWLREDLPHTPIIFLDQSIVVGPRVVPGVTACLHCVRAWRLDRNPATPALDSQLWKQKSPLRGSAWEVVAAFHFTELLRRGQPGESWRVDGKTFEITSRLHEVHPGCDCAELMPHPAGR